MKKMMVGLAIGAGILMTAIAAAIGGLALELVLLMINRSLAATQIESAVREASVPAVIHLTSSDSSTGALDWPEKIAA